MAATLLLRIFEIFGTAMAVTRQRDVSHQLRKGPHLLELANLLPRTKNGVVLLVEHGFMNKCSSAPVIDLGIAAEKEEPQFQRPITKATTEPTTVPDRAVIWLSPSSIQRRPSC